MSTSTSTPTSSPSPHPRYGAVVLGALGMVVLVGYLLIRMTSPTPIAAPRAEPLAQGTLQGEAAFPALGEQATPTSSLAAVWEAMQFEFLLYVGAGFLLVGMFLFFRWRANRIPHFNVLDHMKLGRFLDQEWNAGRLTPNKVFEVVQKMDGVYQERLAEELRIQAGRYEADLTRHANELRLVGAGRQDAEQALKRVQTELLKLKEEAARTHTQFQSTLSAAQGQLATIQQEANRVPKLVQQVTQLTQELAVARQLTQDAQRAEEVLRGELASSTEWGQQLLQEQTIIVQSQQQELAEVRAAGQAALAALKAEYRQQWQQTDAARRETHQTEIARLEVAHKAALATIQGEVSRLTAALVAAEAMPRLMPLHLKDDRLDPVVARVCALLGTVSVNTHGGKQQSFVLDSWRRQRALLQALNRGGLRLAVEASEEASWQGGVTTGDNAEADTGKGEAETTSPQLVAVGGSLLQPEPTASQPSDKIGEVVSLPLSAAPTLAVAPAPSETTVS